MRYYQLRDPFADRQPKMTFAEELSLPFHNEPPKNFGKRALSSDEISLEKIRLEIEFSDELLDTAYEDFYSFARVYGIEICAQGVPVRMIRERSRCFEAYSIKVAEDGVTVSADDTEGIRRAIFYIEDEMKRRCGARLPLGETERYPFIKTRISRCYFSPASHAAVEKRENELIDAIDYYPDEYLNRLAHDGINALWLGASIKYLVKSDIITEYGCDAEVRMRKLNSVIEKCRRYGIKTYLFSVDPASDYCNEELHSHPDMMGIEENIGIKHICPSVDKTVEYLKEAYKRVFTEAKGLAGYINLSVGESESHCGSERALLCERCKKKFGTLGRTLAFVEKTIADAIHEVAPDAEYVSWTYAQRMWKDEDIKDSAEHRDPSVRHLVNFEDLGVVEQLERERLAYDYWISYVGPGELFKKSLEYDRARGVKTYAKIQVCSSHEISTVPYIIAPGLLYEKYRYMRENSVEGVMQCWFFGNYPCLMNKAAGELSFEPFFEKKEDFLKSLASIYWGEEGERVASAYEKFADGYRNFPVGVAFEWYSPMQDSPVCPYHLEPVDLPMPSTWLLSDMVGSDRVCDSLLDGHTLPEAVELCRRMSNGWDEGVALISAVKRGVYPDAEEQITVALATGLIFRSGYNTLRFYDMRNELALGHTDNPSALLREMACVVEEEIKISEALIPICKADNRIGYHSEAHGYKIFPEKLEWRIAEMKKLLSEEFKVVEDRISRGERPLPFYYGECEESVRYEIEKGCISEAKWLNFVTRSGYSTENARIRASYCEGGYELEIEVIGEYDCVRVDPEFKMFHRTSPLFLSGGKLEIKESAGYSLFGKRLEEMRSIFTVQSKNDGNKEYYALKIPSEALGMRVGDPFRLMISVYRENERRETLGKDDRVVERLVLGRFSPDAFVFFVPKSDHK